jgi:hypothetical protein
VAAEAAAAAAVDPGEMHWPGGFGACDDLASPHTLLTLLPHLQPPAAADGGRAESPPGAAGPALCPAPGAPPMLGSYGVLEGRPAASPLPAFPWDACTPPGLGCGAAQQPPHQAPLPRWQPCAQAGAPVAPPSRAGAASALGRVLPVPGRGDPLARPGQVLQAGQLALGGRAGGAPGGWDLGHAGAPQGGIGSEGLGPPGHRSPGGDRGQGAAGKPGTRAPDEAMQTRCRGIATEICTLESSDASWSNEDAARTCTLSILAVRAAYALGVATNNIASIGARCKSAQRVLMQPWTPNAH